MSIDFWRGMIDGDGSVVWSGTTPQVKLTGQRGISEAFVTFVEAKIALKKSPRSKNYPAVGRPPGGKISIHSYPKGGGTKVILNAENAASLCELLYAKAPPDLCLSRKRAIAIDIVDRFHYRRGRATKANP